jgi:alkyl hydroperoxide reductase subunit AhpC
MEPKGQKSNYCEYCRDFHDTAHEYSCAVRIGDAIPDYEFEALHDNTIKKMKLSSFRGSWLVIMFYPANFTRVCPTEFEDMMGVYPELKEAGGEVVSFSTDTVYAHEAWRAAVPAIGAVDFPMGADPSGKIASAFGVLVEDDDLALVPGEGQALRATFVIDPLGALRTIEIHDTSVGRNAKETLRKVMALKFVDSAEGNVCPGGWEGK